MYPCTNVWRNHAEKLGDRFSTNVTVPPKQSYTGRNKVGILQYIHH